MAKPKIYQVDQLQTMVGSMNTAITAAHNQANSAYSQANTASNTSNLVLKTGDTMTGNLTFSGTGLRILGDMSNATIGNRLAFQTSITNGNSDLNIIPNGTSVTSGIRLNNNSDTTNAGYVRMSLNSTEASISVDRNSVSGTYLPLGFNTGGSERMRIDTSGRICIATTTGRTPLSVAQFTNGTPALGNTSFYSASFMDTFASYGLGVHVSSATGIAVLQSQRFDGTATAYDIALNPYGGNVGIGTASPTDKFQIEGTGTVPVASIRSTTTGSVNQAAFNLFRGDSTNGFAQFGVGTTSTNTWQFGLRSGSTSWQLFDVGANAARVVVDTSGNVGIGSVPGAWDTGNSVRAIQISSAGALWNYSNNNIYLTQNILWNGTNRVYTVTGSLATEYSQQNGTFVWFNAPSGTAGNTVTLTERMRITSSGNVGIGTSTPGSRLHVYTGNPGSFGSYYTETLRVDNSGNVGVFLGTPQANKAYISHGTPLDGASAGIVMDGSARYIAFFTVNGAERMRINSGGNAGIGQTNPNARLDVLADSGDIVRFITSAGTGVSLAAGSTSFTTLSDERKKTDLVPITNATNKLKELRTVVGRYNQDEVGVERAFLIAQDVQKVFSPAVDANNPDELGLRYVDMIPLLVASIKELKAELDNAKAEIAALKNT